MRIRPYVVFVSYSGPVQTVVRRTPIASAIRLTTTRWPLRRQRRSRRKLAAAYSCGGLRCTVRTRFESISGLAHQWRSLSPCGACAMRLGTTRQYWLRCQAEPKDCEPDDCHDSNETRSADWPANIHLRGMAESRRPSGAIRASMGIAWRDESCSPQPKGQRALSPPPQPRQLHLQSDLSCAPAYHSRERAGVKAA